MEFLIGVGTGIAEKVAAYTVAPVGRQLGYVFLYRRNLDNLKIKIQELNLKKKTMEDLANDAKRQGDEIHDDIKDCLIKVGKINRDSEKLLSNTDQLKCSFVWPFSCLVSLYQQSKKAKEMGDSVVEIRGKIRLDNISYRPKIRSIFENKDYLTFATRDKFVDGIMEVLGDDGVKMIGVHGMPGAGKTTLVKEIARKALENERSLFDDAVIVTVSQTPNLENIQQLIADRLDLKFSKKMIPERALELRKRLKDENMFLIILDDLWNKLNLEDLGIVFESDKKGCKIMMTSRFERVLGNDMSVDRNFKVELLSEDEATNWFNDIVGDVVETRGFKKLGNKIAKKCGRLPLVIVTVAHSLKNCDKLPLWKDTWRQLRRSKHSEVVRSAIKLCYDKLQGDEAKRLLLLCALHEEDANIEMEYLMRYGVGQMDMFKDVYTLQEARDLVHRLVDQLKDRCLLLDGDGFETVKMHDVIRDIAISIGKESHNMHCFRDGREVVEFTKEKKFEDLKAISLPNGYLNELTCERSEYRHLQLILCTSRERPSQTIPHQFFKRAKQLTVLDFSNTAFAFFGCPKVLASSLLPLQNLRTLCLRNSDVEDIALIGELSNLEILDLSNTKTKKLPSQIGQLSHLRMLDLSGCSRLEAIEPNVILDLEQLEELYIEYFEHWHELEGSNVERKNAGVDELNYLVRLTALDLHVPNLRMLPHVLPSKKLIRFKIKIGVNVNVYDYDYDILESSISRYLRIKHCESSILRKHCLEMLVERSEVLFLDGLNGVNNIANELDTDGFPELKILRLENNNTIQYLVNLTGKIQPCTVFGTLHTLFLVNLRNLKEICNGKVPAGSFGSLRVVKVRSCMQMKKLLPFSAARQLEKIKIFYCKEMEEIFTYDKEDHDDDGGDMKEVIGEFPQLRSLKLRNTSKLREFCSKKTEKISLFQKEDGPFVADTVRPLFDRKFLCFPKLENLRLSGCHIKKIWDDQLLASSTASFCRLTKLVVVKCEFLKYVFSSATAVSFEQLRSLVVSDCVTMQELMSRDERINNMSFPNLDSLELKNLPNLVTFSYDIFIELPMLTHLSIKNCPEFKTIVSKSSQPEICTIITSLFNEKVALPSLKSVKIDGMDRLKMIWQYGLCTNADSFCKLEEVEIENCKNIMKIFPCGMDKRLPNLTSLEISDCKMVEEIFEIQTTSNSEEICDIIFTKWKYLGLHRLPNLKYVWTSKYPQGTFIFPNLEEVKAFQCPNLKAIFSPSVAKGLSGLKKLNIKKCGIEEIVGKEEGLGTAPSEFIFPQLQIMQLISLPNLVSFYGGPNISRFPLLEKLQVKECIKVKVLFSLELLSFQSMHGSSYDDIQPVQQPLFVMDKFLCFPKLEKLELSGCHMKKTWDDQLLPSFTSFRLIKKLVVVKCRFLKFVFSSSATATSFEQLLSLEVRDCETMEEIMSGDKMMDNISFPNLKFLDLKNLPNMAAFSYNLISIMFPMLTHLSIKNCPEFKSFVFNKSPQEKSCTTISSLFNEKVAFPMLKSVNIDGLDCLKVIWQYELCSNAYSFCELEEVKVKNCKNLMKIIPCGMHKRLPNLTGLEIINCEMVGEIFEIQTSNCEEIYDMMSTQLKYLELHHLPNLKYVWSKDPQGPFTYSPNIEEVEKCGIKEIVGKEEALKKEAPDFVLFPQFERMVLKSLPNLVSFYAGSHTLGFPFLKWLEVENCMKLKVFFTSQFLGTQSTHGSGNCDIPIQQPALFFMDKILCYPNLENLRLTGCFIKKIWDDQLLRSSTSFSLLKKLVVVKCHFLKYVFSSAMAASFEQLDSLEVRDCETMQEIISRDETMDNISFPNLDSLDLKNLPNLVTFSLEIFIKFPVLTHISIENCPEFKTFVSKSLEGKYTPSLFNEKVAFPCLKSVKIDGMDTLKMIWQSKIYDADSFWKLEEVEIENCKNLRKIFPYGTHRRLSNLTSLEISDCEMVEEIFEIQTSNSEEIYDIISTQLKYLGLRRLQNLKHVWTGKYPQGTFSFPNLEEVEAFQCPNLKAIFPPSVAKGLSQLKKLNIEKCGIEEIVGKEEGLGTVPPEFVFPQLQTMQLISLPELVSFCAGSNTSRFPLLEKLQVKECIKVMVLFSSELLRFQRMHESGYGDVGLAQQPLFFTYKVAFGSGLHHDVAGEDQECSGTLSHLRKLNLCQLPNLMNLVEESSQQSQTLAFQDLTNLQVSRCGRLNNLDLSSIMRFQNLRDLRVSNCHGMLHLLSSQTAKSLTQLIAMKISKCKRMAEVIADSTEGSTEGGEIAFNGLRCLVLDSLPRLSCFYSGKYAMGFPNLKGVIVSRCLELQTFSKHGITVTPKLKDININEINEESDSEAESEPEPDSDSESELSSIEITKDISTTISHHWMNRDGSALQKLFAETDLEPSNLSNE